ncbi:MerR family DNA-binding transcriptional regulator [Nonomuraea sp. B10E15]|uniref:MerR family DNA-binding transcriptional regulator n=1 Tax=Nonomuraea sp. B10E15 TaxID=3153560 RepID=UPI00325EB638
MPWSTRELAGLAGTTVNTIRHYHRLGLLDEPERRYNGGISTVGGGQFDDPHLRAAIRPGRLGGRSEDGGG